MALFAKCLLFLLVAVAVNSQDDYFGNFGFTNPNFEIESSVPRLPLKRIKYNTAENPSFSFKPSSDIPLQPVPQKPKKATMFTPNAKFVTYMNSRVFSGQKDIIPQTYKASNPKNLNQYKPLSSYLQTDLKAVSLPLTQSYDPKTVTNPDPSAFKQNFKLQQVPNLYPLQRQFEEAASKKQIEKFYEDQQKEIDEAIELQLLNDPNPNSKGKYHQFLKAKEDERIEKEYEETLKESGQKLANKGTSYAPVKLESRQPFAKSATFGLGHFRTFQSSGPTLYSFQVQI